MRGSCTFGSLRAQVLVLYCKDVILQGSRLGNTVCVPWLTGWVIACRSVSLTTTPANASEGGLTWHGGVSLAGIAHGCSHTLNAHCRLGGHRGITVMLFATAYKLAYRSARGYIA